jgi:hypothetical protein
MYPERGRTRMTVSARVFDGAIVQGDELKMKLAL